MTISDFLPLPIIESTQFNTTSSTFFTSSYSDGTTVPENGGIGYGPSDTYHLLQESPSMSVSSSDNSLLFNYGSFPLANDSAGSSPYGSQVIDLLYTVQITDTPTLDELTLTNQGVIYANNFRNVSIKWLFFCLNI